MAKASLKVILGSDVSRLDKGLRHAERSLKQTAGRLNAIGGAMTRTLTLPILGIGAAAIKAAVDYEAFQKGLESAMGSAEAARKELQELEKVSKLPGVGLKQAIKASVRLQTLKVGAEDARNLVRELGNAIALVGGGSADLDEVVNQFAQMAASTSLTQKDIKVISERLPQFQSVLKEAFGTNQAADINKLFKSGELSVKEFVKKSVTELSKLDRAQGGLKNAFENIRIELQKGLATIGLSIAKNIDLEATVKSLTNRITNIVEWWGKLDKSKQKTIITTLKFAAILGPGAKLMAGFLNLRTMLIGVRRDYLKWMGGLTKFPNTAQLIVGNTGKIIGVIGVLGGLFLAARKKYLEMSSAMDLSDFDTPKEKIDALSKSIKTLNERIEKNKELAQFQGRGQAGFNLFAQASEQKLGKEKAELAFQRALALEQETIGAHLERNAEQQGVLAEQAEEQKVLAEEQRKEQERINKIFADREAQLANISQIMQNDLLKGLRASVFDRNNQFVDSGGFGNSLPGIDQANLQPTGVPILPTLDIAPTRVDEVVKQSEALTDNFGTLEGMWKRMYKQGDITFSELQEKMQAVGKVVLDVGALIEDGLTGTISALGSELGKALAGGGFSLKNVLMPLLDMLSKFADLAIATGIAAEGIKKSLSLLGPFAIVAGFALKALVGVVKNKISNIKPKGYAAGGIFSGEQTIRVGEYPGATFNPEVVAPLDKLQKMIGGGVQQQLTARISGPDLLLLMERVSSNRNSSRSIQFG